MRVPRAGSHQIPHGLADLFGGIAGRLKEKAIRPASRSRDLHRAAVAYAPAMQDGDLHPELHSRVFRWRRWSSQRRDRGRRLSEVLDDGPPVQLAENPSLGDGRGP
jgi:hypothetical protein